MVLFFLVCFGGGGFAGNFFGAFEFALKKRVFLRFFMAGVSFYGFLVFVRLWRCFGANWGKYGNVLGGDVVVYGGGIIAGKNLGIVPANLPAVFLLVVTALILLFPKCEKTTAELSSGKI